MNRGVLLQAIAIVAVSCMLSRHAGSCPKVWHYAYRAVCKPCCPNTANLEVTVWETALPRRSASNPRHMHPAAITFRMILSGTGIWQEDGKSPVTLHVGDSLFAAAGTVHSHWNPSKTEPLRFLEFTVAEKRQGCAPSLAPDRSLPRKHATPAPVQPPGDRHDR